MRIGYFSDLHLDFYPRHATQIVQNICDQAQSEGVELLMFAGDMCNSLFRISGYEARNAFKNLPGIRFMETLGNHDFYYEEFFDEHQSFNNLNGKPLNFFCGTLWTDFHNDPRAEYAFKSYMSDAKAVRNISVAGIKAVFNNHKKLIFDGIYDVVMTHNPPSWLSVGPAFQGQEISNKIFIPELGNEIAESTIKLWVCGHVHHKHEYTIGNTKVVCNPLGYPGEIYKDPSEYKIGIIDID